MPRQKKRGKLSREERITPYIKKIEPFGRGTGDI